MESSRDPLGGANLAFVEQLYAHFLDDPASVDPTWRAYFAAMAEEDGDLRAARMATEGPGFKTTSLFNPPSESGRSAVRIDTDQLPDLDPAALESRVSFLRGVRLLSGLDKRELGYLARLAREEVYDDGSVLGNEGER
ncbi:MAG: hypothetical protein AAF725_25670, partial [Acidobacteriota bacterium]